MFWKKFLLLCQKNGKKPTNVIREMGLSSSSVTAWKNGAQPREMALAKVADYFGVDVDYFKDEAPAKKKNVIRVPVYSNIAAGVPIESMEEIEDYEELDADKYPRGKYMALKIAGDSMAPMIKRGDIVIIYRQDYAEDDDIAIVMVNGCDATCKRVRAVSDGIELVSENTAYCPMHFTREEIDTLPVSFWGVVIEIRRKLFRPGIVKYSENNV